MQQITLKLFSTLRKTDNWPQMRNPSFIHKYFQYILNNRILKKKITKTDNHIYIKGCSSVYKLNNYNYYRFT